jgi:hypothetical protein
MLIMVYMENEKACEPLYAGVFTGGIEFLSAIHLNLRLSLHGGVTLPDMHLAGKLFCITSKHRTLWKRMELCLARF